MDTDADIIERARFCHRCQDLFDDFPGTRSGKLSGWSYKFLRHDPHHANFNALELAAAAACYICMRLHDLWKDLESHDAPEDPTVVFLAVHVAAHARYRYNSFELMFDLRYWTSNKAVH